MSQASANTQPDGDIFKELRHALDDYLKQHKPEQIISVRHAVDTIRNSMGECTLSDDELSNYVTDYAVTHGCNVHFDGKSKPNGFSLP